jgi:membrane peptidoglycan carboxypeptidase
MTQLSDLPPRAIPPAEYSSDRRRRVGRGRLSPSRQRRPLRRRLVRAALLLIAVLSAGLLLLIGYAAFTLPSLTGLGRVTATLRVVDRGGATVAEVGNGNTAHATVPLTAIATVLQQAVIAAEDRSFYDEGGVNPGRIVKAAVVDVVLRRPAEGASTITQQLARMALLPDDKSLMRKLREVLLADEIDRTYSKAKILEMYLNSVYLGHGAYGVEEAAQTYFGKHASQLSLPEASLLAGLLQAPSSDDPTTHADAAFARQAYVLEGMLSTGAITKDQAAAAAPTAAHRQALLAELNHPTSPVAQDSAPHFVEYVREQVVDLLGPEVVANSHLTVTTTLDSATQAKAQAVVTSGVASLGRNANNGALLMIDARSGNIIAMVGSAAYNDASIAGAFNVTTTALRRPGSSFKPYVYAAGYLDGRLTPNTMLEDTAQESAALGGVHDFDNGYLGTLPAWKALLLSRNIPAEQAMETAGEGNVIGLAHSMGISSDLAANASTAIGTSSVRMIEHAGAYAAFANGGRAVVPRAILRITDERGGVLYDGGPTGASRTVMSPQQAWMVTGALRQYNEQWSVGINRDVAGKSGTTDSFVDAWFMAYTPDWVVATWAGHTSGSDPSEVGMDGVYGTDVGRAIAAPFINGLGPSAPFQPPPGAWNFAPAPPPPGGDHGGGEHGDGGGGKHHHHG